MTDEKAEFTRTYRHAGADPKELRAEAKRDEKAAAAELGGPAKRSTKFINGGDDIVVTWRRVNG